MRRAAGQPLRIASLAKQVPVAGVVPPQGGTAGAAGCRRRDERVLPPRRGGGGHTGPGHRGLVHRRHPRAPRGRGRPARGGRLGGDLGSARLRPGLRRLRHARHGAGPGGRVACLGSLRPRPARPQLHRRGDRAGGARGGGAPRPPVRQRCAPARGRRLRPAPRARARRRQAGGRDRVAGGALRRRAPVRTVQGGPPGPGRRPGLAASPGSTAGELGDGPWGQAGSPTVVGETRPMEHERSLLVLEGPAEEQVRTAVHELARRGALDPGPATVPVPPDQSPIRSATIRPPGSSPCSWSPAGPEVAGELLGAAAQPGARGGRHRPRAVPRRGHGGLTGRRRRRPRRRARRVARRRGRGRCGRRLRARRGALGPARPEHGLRPRGGRARRGRDGLGARGRRHRALRTGRRTRGGQARLCRRAGGRHHVPQRHPDGHGPARCAAGAGGARAPRGSRDNAPRRDAGPGPGAVRAPRRRHRDAGPGSGGDRRRDRGDTGGIRAAEPARRHPGGRARGDQEGHRPGVGTALPPGRHHGTVHRPPPVRRARAEREVQPHGGCARRGDHPGRQRGSRAPRSSSTATSASSATGTRSCRSCRAHCATATPSATRPRSAEGGLAPRDAAGLARCGATRREPMGRR